MSMYLIPTKWERTSLGIISNLSSLLYDQLLFFIFSVWDGNKLGLGGWEWRRCSRREKVDKAGNYVIYKAAFADRYWEITGRQKQ